MEEPVAVLLHVIVPLHPVAIRSVDCPTQIEVVGLALIAGAGGDPGAVRLTEIPGAEEQPLNVTVISV